MTQWKITTEESGIKLQAFLKSKLPADVSAREIKRALESHLCTVNGRVERHASTLLGTGDIVCFKLLTKAKISKTIFQIEKSRFLFEDEDLLIYDKPAGIASEGQGLEALMKNYFPDAILVHRLDKETTGVLIFSKNKNTFEKMCDLFREQKIEKTYLAIVDGIPTKKQGVIENYLGKLHAYQGQTLWGESDPEHGLYAYTAWSLEKTFPNKSSLVKCYPKTGRTHQIRVHLSSIGLPILGDYQYGRTFRCSYKPNRYLLHALAVTFIHPISRKKMTITAPIPNDFVI